MSRFTHQMASYWKQLGAVIRNEFQTIFKDGGAMLILIFALGSKYFIKGLMAGAVKG